MPRGACLVFVPDKLRSNDSHRKQTRGTAVGVRVFANVGLVQNDPGVSDEPMYQPHPQPRYVQDRACVLHILYLLVSATAIRKGRVEQ